ncbi:hypothetical protein ACHAWF_015912 [Thalassiosira exigua]
MAKACEIAVRGRCTVPLDEGGNAGRGIESRRSWNYYGGGPGGPGASNGPSGGSGSTSSRFNIEVDEVPAVREVVRSWRGGIHVPLRLDVYYEHDGCFGEMCRGDTGTDPPPPPQRELLERWCVDYVPSPSGDLGASSSYDRSSSSGGGGVSQLRRVCKRVVVLLRSLHCLTRMLPSHRLRCLLISHMSAPGGVAVNDGVLLEGGSAGGGAAAGWGSIGFSVYAGEPEAEPTLPSPSFARQSLPAIPTPYGSLRLSVMYDATLNPNHMASDLAERRAEWMQGRWPAAGGVPWQQQYHQQQQQQQLHEQKYDEQPQAGITLTSTQPIPISHVGQQAGSTSRGQPHGVNEGGSCPNGEFHGPREYSSAPAGQGPASLGSTPGRRRSRAVSEFIISDYHYSPKLKPLASPLSEVAGKGEDPKRVMSGLSLAMMNEADNTSPVEQQDRNTLDNGQQRLKQIQQQDQDDIILSFGSPVTRAAFHSPPPAYPDADVRHRAQSSGLVTDDDDGRGTHFFQRHGGYGYGYNGANVQFDQGPASPSPPAPSGSLGSSPGPGTPLMGTPPTSTIWANRRTLSAAGSNSPSAPPFVNPTSLQPPPSPRTRSGDEGVDTPATSPSRQHPRAAAAGDVQQQQKQPQQPPQRKRTSSSSAAALLPPVASLDMLQKSPFLATRKAQAAPAGTGDAGGSHCSILGSYRDSGAFVSSIPRLVDGGGRGIVVSGLGVGSSGGLHNPLSSIAGGYFSTGPHRSSLHEEARQTEEEAEEELPFAVDDDSPPLGPLGQGGSRTLWDGSTRVDMMDGTMAGDGVAEITSAMAVSSLHHRCAAERKIRLKMFDGVRRRENSAVDAGGSHLNDMATAIAPSIGGDQNDRPDFASIRDQLSDFRSFGASLMVSSGTQTHGAGTD